MRDDVCMFEEDSGVWLGLALGSLGWLWIWKRIWIKNG